MRPISNELKTWTQRFRPAGLNKKVRFTINTVVCFILGCSEEPPQPYDGCGRCGRYWGERFTSLLPRIKEKLYHTCSDCRKLDRILSINVGNHKDCLPF